MKYYNKYNKNDIIAACVGGALIGGLSGGFAGIVVGVILAGTFMAYLIDREKLKLTRWNK